MKITILTKEESLELNRIEREKKLPYTTEQIIDEAKSMRRIPFMGNTQYIIGEKEWENFYDWLTSAEARQQWNIYTSVLPLARYFAWKYVHAMSDKDIDDLIKNEMKLNNKQ